MVRFLDKEKELHLLDKLFGLMHENMSSIAPSGIPREREKAQWIPCIREALMKPPRQILLLYAGTELAGFCMYYVNGGVFMIEELQIQKEFRQTTLMTELVRFLGRILPRNTGYVEAYAHKQNRNSQRLMEKLGMIPLGEAQDGSLIHFWGSMDCIFRLTK